MVILQFNKLIRNKWIWGAFAVAVCAFFVLPDSVIDNMRMNDGEDRSSEGAGTLAGEAVKADLFRAIANDVRGIGRSRDNKMDQAEVNRVAWENYALLKVAEENGITATDEEVAAAIRRDPSFQQNGAFSFLLYQGLLRQNGLTPESFEASLKRSLTLRRVSMAVLGSAAWVSPIEVDRAVADMTDKFTVKVARFAQDAKEAAAVKLDEAGLKKWYDDNVKSLNLPERIKIRFVKFDATATNVLAKMTVTENDIRDRFDSTADKYTTTDTNGVSNVKKFDELTAEEKEGIEKDLRRIAAVECFTTNLNERAWAVKAAAGLSRLDEIAKEDGFKVEESDWFALDGGYQEGFMRRSSGILPGAQGFDEAVAELDMESEDLRYAVVASDRAVWLIEKKTVSPAHTPTFDEAKDAIRPRALRAAKADAFKASVEAVAKKGVAAVEAVKDISTNLVFSVSDLKSGTFPDQMSVARAAMTLKKGEISEFTLTSTGRGLLVVCVDREPGDVAQAMILRSKIREEAAMLQARQIPEAWNKWNLARLGFVTGEISSLEKSEEAE